MTCIKGRGILSRLLSKSASACYPETCRHVKLPTRKWHAGVELLLPPHQKMKTDFFRILHLKWNKLNAAFHHFWGLRKGQISWAHIWNCVIDIIEPFLFKWFDVLNVFFIFIFLGSPWWLNARVLPLPHHLGLPRLPSGKGGHSHYSRFSSLKWAQPDSDAYTVAPLPHNQRLVPQLIQRRRARYAELHLEAILPVWCTGMFLSFLFRWIWPWLKLGSVARMTAPTL